MTTAAVYIHFNHGNSWYLYTSTMATAADIYTL